MRVRGRYPVVEVGEGGDVTFSLGRVTSRTVPVGCSRYVLVFRPTSVVKPDTSSSPVELPGF